MPYWGAQREVIQFSKPTHAVTRASTTLGALSTPWTDTITTTNASQGVRYEVAISTQCSSDEVLYAAITRAGTIIDRVGIYTAGGGSRENRSVLSGIDLPASAATHTYEIIVASNSGNTVTVNSTVSTSTAASLTADGVSSMQLELVETA